MRLAPVAAVSIFASLVVAGWAAAAKVRIDARAHLVSAESRHGQALARGDDVELEAAGEGYARAVRSCSPFDPVPAQAAARLQAVAQELLERHQVAAADHLLARGLASIDACGILVTPLAREREELAALRALAAEGARAPAAPGDAAPTAAEAGATATALPSATPEPPSPLPEPTTTPAG